VAKLNTSDLAQLQKQMEQSAKAMERMRIAGSAVSAVPVTGYARREAAVANARELADALNEGYEIERFHPNKVSVDRQRYEAMEKVISAAMVVVKGHPYVADTSKLVLDKRIKLLQRAVTDLLTYDGDRETIIASLIRIEEALSSEDAASEHAV
jgi:hypothetical protein